MHKRIRFYIYKFILIAIFSAFQGSITVSLADDIPKITFTNTNQIAEGKSFVIATQGSEASKAGALMFKGGGNIFDAAVAISFVISVERPQSTGIGGGGFMLIHDAKKKETFAVDFRERAPRGSTEKMFADDKGEVVKGKSTDGVLAVAVPGTVA